MKAADVMVKDIITVKPDSSVDDAIKLLVEHDFSALSVVDETGHMVGIIVESDLMRRPEIGTEKHRQWWMEAITPAATLAHEFAKAHGQRVHDVMSKQVVSASEDTPVGEIATLLERKRIKRIPIVRDGELVGMVSRSNLIQALASSRNGSPGNGHRSRNPDEAPGSACGAGLDRLWCSQDHRHGRCRASLGPGRFGG
jgi:CBS domain-containing protein